MLVVISPAKKLDTATPAPADEVSEPALMDETRHLMDALDKLGPGDIKRLMNVSDKIAETTAARHREFDLPFDRSNAKPAVFTFQGDTYVGLDADSLEREDLTYAQDHLRILSGLYGVLRPLDLIQAYRLEMGAKLATDRGEDLYDFWGGRITDCLNEALAVAGGPLLNCASNEYFGAVAEERLDAPVITPVFKDGKDGKYRVLGLFAKRARGMMARYVVTERVETAAALKNFNGGGYTFCPEESDENRFVYLREQPPKKK